MRIQAADYCAVRVENAAAAAWEGDRNAESFCAEAFSIARLSEPLLIASETPRATRSLTAAGLSFPPSITMASHPRLKELAASAALLPVFEGDQTKARPPNKTVIRREWLRFARQGDGDRHGRIGDKQRFQSPNGNIAAIDNRNGDDVVVPVAKDECLGENASLKGTIAEAC